MITEYMSVHDLNSWFLTLIMCLVQIHWKQVIITLMWVWE